MNRPSIRTRLLVWTTLVTTFIMVGAGYILFQSLRASLYAQFDNVLNDAATVVIIEIEVKNSKIYHEWKESLENQPIGDGGALIQVWDYHTGDSTRSTLLGDHNLEKNHGALGARVFYNLDLPDGRKGRAVGILTLPIIEEQKGNEGFIPEDHPQVFVWAQNTHHLQKILQRARNTFLIAGSAGLFMIWFAIFVIISLSSRAMKKLVAEVHARDGSEVGKALSVPDNLPTEIAGIAERFNSLLQKIDTSRERDRDFFLNVSHEVRTPVAGIRAIIEQALRRPREIPDYQVRLQSALEEVEGLNRLIDRLMKFGRLKQQQNLEPELIDLNQLSQRLWNIFETRAIQKGLNVRWNLDPESHFHSDSELVKVIVTNLLDNAVSYSKDDSTIEITTIRRKESLRLFISNSITPGKGGLPNVSKFFDAFYRADSSRNQTGRHAGIGLSFSWEVMELIGGSISASCSPEGTVTLETTFPLKKPTGH